MTIVKAIDSSCDHSPYRTKHSRIHSGILASSTSKTKLCGQFALYHHRYWNEIACSLSKHMVRANRVTCLQTQKMSQKIKSHWLGRYVSNGTIQIRCRFVKQFRVMYFLFTAECVEVCHVNVEKRRISQRIECLQELEFARTDKNINVYKQANSYVSQWKTNWCNQFKQYIL